MRFLLPTISCGVAFVVAASDHVEKMDISRNGADFDVNLNPSTAESDEDFEDEDMELLETELETESARESWGWNIRRRRRRFGTKVGEQWGWARRRRRTRRRRTPSPTPYPTPYPTRSPTPYPTRSPTPYPTPYPTRSPTPYPTPAPTSPYQLHNLGDSGCSGKSCAVCKGDCDFDSDCQKPYKCFQRDGTTPVPGCIGSGASGTDYCYNPAKATHMLTNRGDAGCDNRNTCEACQGDCDSDSDCDGRLRCWQRSGKEPVPGCTAGGIGDVSSQDFCYDPKKVHRKTLVNIGDSGCQTTQTCAACQGDCDKDSDCTGKLKCFQRDGKTAVPGCNSGGAGDASSTDFCYDPDEAESTTLVNRGDAGCSRASTCQKCQGDCDSDDECMAGLMCFHRNAKQAVRGCISGGAGDVSSNDYCVDKPAPTPSPTPRPAPRPTPALTTASICAKGKGKGKGKGGRLLSICGKGR